MIETSSPSNVSEKTIALNFNALTAKSDISVYVPLPIGTYNSLELGLYDDGQAVWTYSKAVTNTVNRKSLKLEGGDSEKLIDYVDEYGENHGPGVKIGETVWAPVNCGYHATDFKYGKLYQWGRKYGQGGYTSYDSHDPAVPDASVLELVDGPVSLATGQSKDNENKFYCDYNVSSPYDWCDTPDDNLWNSGIEGNPVKTEYDPCPSGWRVPTNAELEGLIENYSSWTTDKNGQSGYWFSGTSSYTETVPQVFFPAAGNIDFYAGQHSSRGNRGYYWSSSTFNYFSYGLYFGSDFVRKTEFYRAFGYSVRCVQTTD